MGYSPWGQEELDMTEHTHTHTYLTYQVQGHLSGSRDNATQGKSKLY